MATIVAVDGSAGVKLDGSDDLYVPRGVQAVTQFHFAVSIDAAGSGHLATVDGAIVSLGSAAVRLGDDDASLGRNAVFVGQEGLVRALSQSHYAVRIFGPDGVVENWGEISGAGGVSAIYARGFGLLNQGVISGGDAAGVLAARALDISIENSGAITGATGISLGTASGRIHNSGEIASIARSQPAINAGQAADAMELVNSGVIRAQETAVVLSDADDTVRNFGAIEGEVRLGAGHDVYAAARGGTVDGKVIGGEGRDELTGASQADLLVGGAQRDTLRGRAGDDDLRGNKGADLIFGGRGDDTMTGGDGADVFVMHRNSGEDAITDFEIGLDRIDLTAFGLRNSQFGEVRDALSNAGGGATFLDLDQLGGDGSALIEGLAFAQAGSGDFIL